MGLAGALVHDAVTRPISWGGALAAAVRMGVRSERGLIHHLIYFAEACVLRRHLAKSGVEHIHAQFASNSAAIAIVRLIGALPTASRSMGLMTLTNLCRRACERKCIRLPSSRPLANLHERAALSLVLARGLAEDPCRSLRVGRGSAGYNVGTHTRPATTGQCRASGRAERSSFCWSTRQRGYATAALILSWSSWGMVRSAASWNSASVSTGSRIMYGSRAT